MVLILTFYYILKDMDYTIIHLRKPNTFNVVCGNGSAHVQRTYDKTKVTCEICNDPKKLTKFLKKISE